MLNRIELREFAVRCLAKLRHQMPRAINVAMRVSTLASKFVLLFVLAKFMTPSEVGQYGLFAATISYALFIVGLDFYTYSTREILGVERDSWPSVLFNQFTFFGVCYVTMLPVLFFVSVRFGAVKKDLLFPFIVLLVLEHLAQELSRLLVVIARPISATVLGFLRGGLWVFFCVGVVLADPKARNIETVILAWTCGSLCSVLFGLTCLRHLPWSRISIRVDWRWIGRGVKVCIPLLLATLSIRGLFVADRYLEGRFAGEEVLGVYTFYISVANAIQAFLDAAVYSFQYPKLVAAARSGDTSNLWVAVRDFRKSILVTVCTLVLFAAVTMWPIVNLLHRPLYSMHYGMFLWILVGTGLFAFSMIPHYVLYAMHRDHEIVITNMAGAIIFIVASPLIALYTETLAVPVALAVACGAMYTSKLLLCRKYRSTAPSILTSLN
jgi:O-antigen/teichoic acid export membrane protein